MSPVYRRPLAALIHGDPERAAGPSPRGRHHLDAVAIVRRKGHEVARREPVGALDLDRLEAIEYVTVYRGKGIDAGHKSLTLRLRFRDHERTLTHDEVDPQIDLTVQSLQTNLDARIRS